MSVPSRLILRGYHGKLYHDGKFMADVPEFSATLNISNTDYQGAGDKLIAGVFTGYSQTLTFTQTHIVSDLLRTLLEHLQGGLAVDFEFMGQLERPDGERDTFVFRGCEPEGSVDLANVSPGAILQRGWSWRVNEPVDAQELLGAYA